jgi:hypothetical protein
VRTYFAKHPEKVFALLQVLLAEAAPALFDRFGPQLSSDGFRLRLGVESLAEALST